MAIVKAIALQPVCMWCYPFMAGVALPWVLRWIGQ